jgi:hypothetical protein
MRVGAGGVGAANERIVAVAAVEDIVAVPAIDDIVAVEAGKGVARAKTVDGVVVRSADQYVRKRTTSLGDFLLRVHGYAPLSSVGSTTLPGRRWRPKASRR